MKIEPRNSETSLLYSLKEIYKIAKKAPFKFAHILCPIPNNSVFKFLNITSHSDNIILPYTAQTKVQYSIVLK